MFVVCNFAHRIWFFFNWSGVGSRSFQEYSAVSQSRACPLFEDFSHRGHCRVSSGLPCGVLPVMLSRILKSYARILGGGVGFIEEACEFVKGHLSDS